jgi:hypothetical protein
MIYHNLPFIGSDDKDSDDDKDLVDDKDSDSDDGKEPNRKHINGSRIGRRIKNIFLYQCRKHNAPKVLTWRHRICGILYLFLKSPYWILNSINWFIENPIDPDLFLLTINPIYIALKPILKELNEDLTISSHEIDDNTKKIITSTEQLAMMEITTIIDMTKQVIKKTPAILDKLDLPLLYIIDNFLEFFSPIDIYVVSDKEIEKMWGDSYKNHKEVVSLLTKIFLTLEKIRDKKLLNL